MNKKSLAYGLLIGGVVGGVASLLTSPSSGKEIRAQIKDKKDDWTVVIEEMKGHIGELKESIGTLSQEGKETVLQLSKDLQASFKQWQASTEPNNQRLQEEIQSIQRTIEELEKSINSANTTNQ
ncbi:MULTISPECIES: YtxH domain-containing protein [Rossellomorea]|uniref:YtxH domain-containing protein n=1 Tax=Rossellomorea vietnamensis TaxID=218284 RepID=A0ACD4CB66_9BACI|nr:YtxH domain-containing protein [Rossellomorea vietnamensis]UXH45845.1 YtxH domain-containing protein [Rossellomorea vietnamensis]WQI97230.1 YtxH domain-containing protein [Rossellomorea vietnamensis]